MASFKNAALLLFENEGGYSNRPGADEGLETYIGISRRYNPGWQQWATIDAIKASRHIEQGEMSLIPVEFVYSFYKTNFWDKLKFDNISNQRVCNQIFDHAVTSGLSDGVKLLQLAANCGSDGVMGPRTQASAIEKINQDPMAFNRRIFKLRTCFYLALSDRSLENEANLPSWISRTCKCYVG